MILMNLIHKTKPDGFWEKAIPTHLTIRRKKAIFFLAHGRMVYLFYLIHKHLNKRKPIPRHTSILTNAIFYNNMGMRVITFLKLLHLLESHGVLKDSRNFSSTEKLGILVYMLITGLSNRNLQEQFQQSVSTIFIEVFLKSVSFVFLTLACFGCSTINQLFKKITTHKAWIHMFISLPGNNVSTAKEITSKPRFSPYFDDCIGPSILAVCNFNMEFTYLMPGLDGSAVELI
ncbi:hypothetical protein VP01_374g5 [Puccinia sorghi]|uniref:DUF8040 domain-containing protein n=1 Tax=Puccinia sorghi TaxID=27349 RepID=A0A0L6UUN9_9BASI|nr:hypothetical protein VP01_374g5 [Puccinia sorghi]